MYRPSSAGGFAAAAASVSGTALCSAVAHTLGCASPSGSAPKPAFYVLFTQPRLTGINEYELLLKPYIDTDDQESKPRRVFMQKIVYVITIYVRESS